MPELIPRLSSTSKTPMTEDEDKRQNLHFRMLVNEVGNRIDRTPSSTMAIITAMIMIMR